MRIWLLSAIGLTAIVTACSDQSGFEKTYITNGGSYVVMLQIQSLDGRNISGSVSSTGFDQNWDLKARNWPISGTIEGQAINFTINYPPGNDPENIPVSGVFDGDKLNLTTFSNGNSNNIVFYQGSAEQYYKYIRSISR